MPIYEVLCQKCGFGGELLALRSDQELACPSCGSPSLDRLMSPPSGLTGRARPHTPGAGDHGCCGARPSEAGCQGPGSCCGKLFDNYS
jgi:putative FmdB family regulatory protein